MVVPYSEIFLLSTKNLKFFEKFLKTSFSGFHLQYGILIRLFPQKYGIYADERSEKKEMVHDGRGAQMVL